MRVRSSCLPCVLSRREAAAPSLKMASDGAGSPRQPGTIRVPAVWGAGWPCRAGEDKGGVVPCCQGCPPPFAVVGSGNGLRCLRDAGDQWIFWWWLSGLGGESRRLVFGVGTTFPGGLFCFWVTWVGSSGFSMCSGMTMEQTLVKGVLQSLARLVTPLPRGMRGPQSLESGGKHLCCAEPPLGLNGCPLCLHQSGWDIHDTPYLRLLPLSDLLGCPLQAQGVHIPAQ